MRAVAMMVVIALVGCSGESRTDADERSRVLAMGSAWIAAARAERCPRQALRTPVTGDGSPLLLGMRDRKSREGQCLARVHDLYAELEPCKPGEDCPLPKLESLKPYPAILEACAALYDKISRIAHASEACSPWNFDTNVNDDGAFVIALDHAVRIQIAPLTRNGELGAAARHVIDAMRFTDDHSRKAILIAPMLGVAVITRLVATLDELLVDPRLTAAEARAVAHDLDVLLASAPSFDAITRQEDAWLAKNIHGMSQGNEVIPELLKTERRARGVRHVCSGTLRACAEGLGEVKVDDTLHFSDYARRFGARDFALTFARMQAELRIVNPEDCSDPGRRRSVLATWLAADRAILGDEHELIVSPPAWQRTKHERTTRPWVLRCVPATL